MNPTPREILEESSSFRPSLEKEKIVFEYHVSRDYGADDPRDRVGRIEIIRKELRPLIGKRVRVTIEEIE